jgi:hypothetical protein
MQEKICLSYYPCRMDYQVAIAVKSNKTINKRQIEIAIGVKYLWKDCLPLYSIFHLSSRYYS